jgi:hypothetical protein
LSRGEFNFRKWYRLKYWNCGGLWIGMGLFGDLLIGIVLVGLVGELVLFFDGRGEGYWCEK